MKNKKYTDWVKQLPCAHCGIDADDPHHLICYGGTTSGKSSDIMTVPLCREHHSEVHLEWVKDRETLLYAQLRWLERTLRKAIEDGVIKV